MVSHETVRAVRAAAINSLMIDRPPLSLALNAFRSGDDPGPRELLEWAAGSGFRWATLDGAARGVRARELDRSARRDLASLMRRLELGFAGVDLFIPPAHFADPGHADRAVSAATGAIELVADIAALNGGEPVIGLMLPAAIDPSILGTLLAHADSRGVRLADHAWPTRESSETLGVGIDPAALLMASENPAKVAARLGGRLALARLSDASELGRVEPGLGRGRLNDLAYAVALQTAGYDRPVVLDCRGLADPSGAAIRSFGWWCGS